MKYARFYLEKRGADKTDKRKEWPVVIWFNYNGKSFHRTIGLRCSEQNWDSTKQRIKLNHFQAEDTNKYIDELEIKINRIYAKALDEGRPIDNKYIIEQLKNPEKKAEPEKKKLSIFEEWESYLTVQSVRLRKGTMKSARSAFNHFKKFCSEKGYENITFDGFTDKVKAEFAEYLYGKGDVDNTIHAVLKRMTRFLNYAEKIGLHSNHTHKAFNIPERPGTIKFLEWEEVKRLIDLEVEPGIESDARDLFVFGCLTGLRWSDVQNLKKLNIQAHKFKEFSEVQYALHIRQQKTSKPVVIPLLPHAKVILDRYKNEKTEYALPQRANQSVNRVIKLLARRAKINQTMEIVTYRKGVCETKHVEKWRIVATHAARRSFATCLLNNDIPINLACSITGQDPKTMLIHYAGVIDSKKFEVMDSKMKF